MFTIKTLIQLITILAIPGTYLVVHTTNILRSRIDIKTLGAKAFLNDSFFRDILGSTLDESNIYLMQNLIKIKNHIGKGNLHIKKMNILY
ncbi:MAG: hypothetical protein ACXVHU_09010 [Methanobacterium sp.]